MARRRGLTPEDRRVWDRVAASTTPLRPLPRAGPAPETVPLTPDPLPHLAGRVRGPRRDEVLPDSPRITFEFAPDPHAGLERANPHMDRRRFEKLRRGRLEPEARLDLHGMTAERAHAALTGFIRAAHAQDRRLVLVITGKGRAEDSAVRPGRHGILRHSLPHWLAAPPLGTLVLQVAPAHRSHGGGGAFYVYLRRRR